MSTEHLQTETPSLPYNEWLEQLRKITLDRAGHLEGPVKINESEAIKWYNDGFTPYATFRENYSL